MQGIINSHPINFIQKKMVLVTGTSGFIGRKLPEFLLFSGVQKSGERQNAF